MTAKKLSDITSRVKEHMAASAGTPPPAPRVLSAPSQLLHYTEDYQRLSRQAEQLRVELAEAAGKPVVVNVDDLDEGPYHSSPLDPERVRGLVENLRHNPQSTPIVIRPKAEGRFEIVAGRHRRAAFKELGREQIEATIKHLDDDQAERLVFFDNLLAPNLSDYEKYLGFAHRQKSKGTTQAQLAEEAGISPAIVTMLMSFEALPAATHSAIQANPRLVGAGLAYALGPHAKTHPDRVTEAIQLVIAGKLKQSRAPAWVAGASATAPAKSVTKVYKRGKAKYAELTRRASHVVVKCQTDEDARELAKELDKLLQMRAAQTGA